MSEAMTKALRELDLLLADRLEECLPLCTGTDEDQVLLNVRLKEARRIAFSLARIETLCEAGKAAAADAELARLRASLPSRN
jgi:hypothetical protein